MIYHSIATAVTQNLTPQGRPAGNCSLAGNNNPNSPCLSALFRILVIGIWLLFRISDFGFRISACWGEQDISSIPIEVNGDQVEYFDAEKKVVGKGNVVVTYKDVKMTCKQVTAYLDSKEAEAMGDVVVTQGDDILKGEKIIYNFQTETGTIIKGVAKSDVWYGGGEEIKKVSPQELNIKDGYITTCDLDKPHYRIRARGVKIYLGKRIVAKNVTFNIGNIPIMYLPIYTQPLKENFPKINVVAGHDKKWGTYLLSSYRYNLTDDTKGNLHLDYRENKGFGEGVDCSFKTDNFGKGYIRTYYIDERDALAHTEKERWRVLYRHKLDIRPDMTAILEYHKMSDNSFTKDYFYREEFEKVPQPQSLISLLHARPGYSANILVRKRLNRFFSETERLPEAKLNINNQRLMEKFPLFYKADFDVANINKKVAGSDKTNSVIRIDTYNQFSIPFRLVDFLSIDPYVGTRQTFYTREVETNKSHTRGILYSGVDVSTNFYRIYDVRTNRLNLEINGLRHIFTPNIRYFYIQKPTLLPQKLFQFDDIDSLDKKKGIGLAFENKLQTKRLGTSPFFYKGWDRNELNTAELARWFVETDYLLHLGEGKRFSDIISDLELRPYSWLFAKQTVLYDSKWKDVKALNTDLTANDPKDKWRFGFGHRYEKKTSSQLTTELETKLTSKWKIRLFERYEFKDGDFKEQEYSVTRDLHCWEAEFTYSVRDVHTFWVIFRLKAFPELPLKLGTSYYRPKVGLGNE